ncbi:hypothetical protein [Natrialba sp. SSL1]|uniref:hypothetical protein n=1 Tax=Natrialba sp. SSL1 TaxID=1869245 RepID=UPI0008F8DA73|nr:hypothetical protein [Natrialba sp. SSL1]OIB55690.1 hypothetical protein BBD46_05175 [Natrialba sp. SSL1]
MDGVLNEHTKTIHKHRDEQTDQADVQTICGATAHVTHGRLQVVPIERTTDDRTITRCGRCFSDADGGGY